jgi:hypothetical protein
MGGLYFPRRHQGAADGDETFEGARRGRASGAPLAHLFGMHLSPETVFRLPVLLDGLLTFAFPNSS